VAFPENDPSNGTAPVHFPETPVSAIEATPRQNDHRTGCHPESR
jgi:hypothetical protein